MSGTSEAAFLVWSACSVLLFAFLLYHLWSFDRFRCLRWNNGPYSGAFKRFMTYTYLTSVPLTVTYAIGFTIIKYREGYMDIPGYGIQPTPYTLWPEASRRAITPLMLMFSIAWSFEMITHLEELCFWLFLVNADTAGQDWFKSLYFKIWAIGSSIAVIYMPIVTGLTSHDVPKCQAYTFLAGSLGSLVLTIWFTPILWTFNSFINRLKRDGVDDATIIRLTKFHELNSIRIIFRYMMTVPLLILGSDGLTTHMYVNSSSILTDLFFILAALGCVISSGITLVIFFPRSTDTEIRMHESRRNTYASNTSGHVGTSSVASMVDTPALQHARGYMTDVGGTYMLTETPGRPSLVKSAPLSRSDMVDRDDLPHMLPPIQPIRLNDQNIELGFGRRNTVWNPTIHHFRSPIGMSVSLSRLFTPSYSFC
ncbi:hypothetical protein FISHEDRAFT_48082 [Fistulina hepatica ATCC 64428]|uniref:STE3-domain-containing protein n=1 Tax=Fistulina hepatica ATCC 64428 TaxID=1128425 RepID=A0A0D7A8A1_9AGAR|nr:hypothetical protein FISHEDRAFT_48082 [Fistulina hepatica ATCC 64428]